MRYFELFESKFQGTIEVEQMFDDIFPGLRVTLEDTAEDARDFGAETDSRSMRAAPDTSKFTSTAYGMVKVENNVNTGGGYYSPSRTYNYFLKIGSAVSSENRKKIEDSFVKWLDRNQEINLPGFGNFIIITADGYRIHFSETSGTAWGGFGFFYEKPRNA